MSFVVSFQDYQPQPRFDNEPFTIIQIEEASDQDGLYTLIDTITLSPVDADPSIPAVRSFTTDQAQIQFGWYRITFLDAVGNEQPFTPVHIAPSEVLSFLPSISKLASQMRARTKDTFGNEIGTFNEETRPTAEEAHSLIVDAAQDVVSVVGMDLPESTYAMAAQVIALGAAMRVELSYFSEQVAQGRSPYDALGKMYDTELKRLGCSVRLAQENNGVLKMNVPANKTSFSFPASSNWMTRRM